MLWNVNILLFTEELLFKFEDFWLTHQTSFGNRDRVEIRMYGMMSILVLDWQLNSNLDLESLYNKRIV